VRASGCLGGLSQQGISTGKGVKESDLGIGEG